MGEAGDVRIIGKIARNVFVLPNIYWKKFSDFPIPSRDVTNQTLPGRE
jgi:hypothetical protein